MIYKVADNILSPLGVTTEQNYQAVVSGGSALKRYDGKFGLPEPFTAALFEEQLSIDGLTRFESLVVRSVRQALESVSFDMVGKNVMFILSTTKGNVENLGRDDADSVILYPGESAQRIAETLGLTTVPIVVCSACVSGLSAIILATRLLEVRQYDYAIVCGADVLNRFVLSGFQSLKALSSVPCKPFDIDRLGLNLGEAVATMILESGRMGHRPPMSHWTIHAGAVRNDAYDITAPSRNGEGAFRALQAVLQGAAVDELALLNAHGVASMFMDQMESVVIQRSGLTDVPVNSLKGYFGHTLGAAGVLETVLTMRALDDSRILGTRGFEEMGVSGRIRVSTDVLSTDRHCFVKMLSGFGGCNATLLVGNHGDGSDDQSLREQDQQNHPREHRREHQVLISPTRVTVDGEQVMCQAKGTQLLTELYKRFVGDYPRFYKMDMLSRLGFIASELLIQREQQERFVPTESRAVILFNHSSSLHTDRTYLQTISSPDDYFPSPSLFVYTLPNIVTGEIAIRNHYHGETSFYILPRCDEAVISQVQQAAFCDTSTTSMITGWLDCEDENRFEADLCILSV